jgi:hypothetical protein
MSVIGFDECLRPYSILHNKYSRRQKAVSGRDGSMIAGILGVKKEIPNDKVSQG